MGEPFLGEVKVISFNFPPKGWAFCNGQLLPVNQNQALFSILSTTYGGNGQTNFGLPNLQTCAPIGWGNGQGLPSVTLGQTGGETAHTLNINEMAGHTHGAMASSTGAAVIAPSGNLLAAPQQAAYLQTSPGTTLGASAVGKNAGDQPHNNLQPYLVLNFIIALQGIYPSRN